MTSTELALRDNHDGAIEVRRASFLPAPHEYRFMQTVAEHLAYTEFVPGAVRGKPPNVLALLLTGREMGIGPMRALRQINIIDGKPSPEPELLMARVLDRGHYIRVVVTTKQHCIVRARRKEWADDEPTFELEWDLDDAVQAELVEIKNGKPWAKSNKNKSLPWMLYTRGMLRSRCVGEVCRAVFPDITEGASYAPEELTQGQSFDPAAREAVLDGLPDELRAQVEDSIDPAAAVRDLANEGVEAGWLSMDERATLIHYAEKHPEHPPRAIARLEQLRSEHDAGQEDDVEDGEIVEDDDGDAEEAVGRGLTEAESTTLEGWGVAGEELSAFAAIATGGRQWHTNGGLADDEAELIMLMGRAYGGGRLRVGPADKGVPTLETVLDDGKAVAVTLDTLREAAADGDG